MLARREAGHDGQTLPIPAAMGNIDGDRHIMAKTSSSAAWSTAASASARVASGASNVVDHAGDALTGEVVFGHARQLGTLGA